MIEINDSVAYSFDYEFPGVSLLNKRLVLQTLFLRWKSRYLHCIKERSQQIQNEACLTLRPFLIQELSCGYEMHLKRLIFRRLKRISHQFMLQSENEAVLKSIKSKKPPFSRSANHDPKFMEFSDELQGLIRQAAALQIISDSTQSKIDELSTIHTKASKRDEKVKQIISEAESKRRAIIDQIAKEKLRHSEEISTLLTQPKIVDDTYERLAKCKAEIQQLKNDLLQSRAEAQSLREEIQKLQMPCEEQNPIEQLLLKSKDQLIIQKLYIQQQHKVLKELGIQQKRLKDILSALPKDAS